ncbi:MAG: Heimdall-CTERM domain-containing surface protein [Promethearchaeota archaeon]
MKTKNLVEDQLVNNHDIETIDPLSVIKYIGDLKKMKKRYIFTIFLLSIAFSCVSTVSADISLSWGPANETGAIFEWTIDDVANENDSTSWEWPYLGLTLKKGETIKFEWKEFNKSLIEITKDTPSTGIPFLNWSEIEITVGSKTADVNETKALMGLVLPVYLHYSGGVVSGIKLMEGYWFSSYPLPLSDMSENIWNLNVEKETAELDVIGENAEEGAEVNAWITTVQYAMWPNGTEMPGDPPGKPAGYAGRQLHMAFDLTIDAKQGVVKTIDYPSTYPQTTPNSTYPYIKYPVIANNATDLTDGLKTLEISLSTDLTGDWPAAAPGFELAIVTTSFVILAVIISRRRKE